MDKMRMESVDMTEQNVDKIGALFPNVITEAKDENGKLKKSINFELLKQMLSDDVLDGDEAYEFTWVGKKVSIVEAGKPTRKTLRPCKEESKDWDTTENIYIEGDNLDVLKLLQESYLGKVKMVYIDPPYNTGSDFIYRDDFAQSREEYDEEAGVYDEDGYRLFKNTETNGRFHSDWCSMIYPRLVLVRNLLASDGVIFISIDDGEVAQLRKVCDEVFGSQNFVASIVWQKRTAPDMRKRISAGHDYIIVYTKNEALETDALNQLQFDEKDIQRYKNPDNDPRGPWISTDCTAQAGHGTKDQFYTYTTPKGRIIELQPGLCWRYTKKKMDEEVEAGRIWFGIDGMGVPRKKTYLSATSGKNLWTWWTHSEVGHTQEATKETASVLGASGIFNYPKPLRLLRRSVQIASTPDSLILDFFSGSATTAHAVMQLNAEDGGKRKFIMVQLPEPCDEKSEAAKAGYKNICEIGKERIRRAGEKIKEEAGLTAQDLDIGFRVLKLDSTNMKDVYYGAAEYSQSLLDDLTSNIKDDRTDLDLLYSCLLEWGLPLSLPHTSEEIGGVTVHTINDGDLIACFADNISEAVIKEIAKRQPLRALFRDSSFASSPEKINVEEIFKLLAPKTSVKVI
ncbi:site-specific DNA-methyltransferase [Phosphitispora fastidiosa]|uniref:site-specific DNA-methyltransferase n=1 Tax=Phosphitispora fastidiosa TaxID=2837202 RepID=UPI001E64A25A|nr:site-specific DNA-methyltransferase [Phosphitispora fastidiosa]MBU7006439.1 adenine-specific DNA-methyltransferase [Phosphitispora fastidiosa]